MTKPADDTQAVQDMATVLEALSASVQFMERRDQMNAVVHLAPVRYSPATELVRHGLTAAERMRAAMRSSPSLSWRNRKQGASDV